VWPPPVSASCTGAAGSAFSSSLSFTFSGLGSSSSIARNASERYLPILVKGGPTVGEITSISIIVQTADETLGLGTDYAYEIDVDGSEVQVSAHSPFGVAYGLETLSQFIVQGVSGLQQGLQCATISVVDEPLFAHRGLSIDTARRFYPVKVIKQTLEGLAMTKQNVLHLHLSDSPCWRVESKIYPQLTLKCPMVKGSMNEDGMFYSQGDIADIVEFARVLGIRIIPEFDIPGHAGMAYYTHALCILQVWCTILTHCVSCRYGLLYSRTVYPAGALCSNLKDEGLQCCYNTGKRGKDDQILNDAAGVGLKIVKSIFTEMSALFPDDVMHVGCDETTETDVCTINVTKSFEEEIIEHVASLGKKPTAWEEALVTGAANVAPSMTLQLWVPSRDRVTWTNATELGFNVLRSDFNIFYLDYDTRGTAQKMWFNITAEPATPAQRQRVLGGESAMWGDAYASTSNRKGPKASCMFPGSRDADFGVSAQGCIWPRAAFAAGTWWGFNNHTKDLDEATFIATHNRLVSRGIPSCPCSNLTHNGCNQEQRCGKLYCS
jgi:hexosaminidase